MADERRETHYETVLLDLLWRTRPPGTRGPRGSLTLDQVVRTAIEVAEEEGVAGLSMRKVAERLGVTTMSLYRYVPGKDDLLDLMFEMATGRPDTTGWPEDWRGRLTAWAHGSRRVMLASPWMLDVPIGGPPMGPNNLAWMDAALGALKDTPLTEQDKIGALAVLSGFVLSETRMEVTMRRAVPRMGVAYVEWGQVYAQAMQRAISSEEYPHLTRALLGGAFEDDHAGPEEEFTHNLRFILDAVASLIDTRTRERAGADQRA